MYSLSAKKFYQCRYLPFIEMAVQPNHNIVSYLSLSLVGLCVLCICFFKIITWDNDVSPAIPEIGQEYLLKILVKR